MFGRGSLFPSMFNDPFFQGPFAQMNQMMQDMDSMLMYGHNMLGPPMLQMPGPAPQRQPRQATTIIEEVDGDSDNEGEGVEPIVEEPEEEPAPAPRSQNQRAQRQRQQQQQQRVQPTNTQLSIFDAAPLGGMSMMAGGMGGGGTMFMSSSSFTSVGGPGGVTYQSSSQTRMGPGGVMESKKVVKDGRSGTQAVAVARGLGEQRRTVIRSRNQTGNEQRQDILQHIQPEETQQFEQRWVQAAEQSLPGWGGGVQPQIGFGGQPQQQRLSLMQSGPSLLPASHSNPHAAFAAQQQQQQQHQQFANMAGLGGLDGLGGMGGMQYGSQFGNAQFQQQQFNGQYNNGQYSNNGQFGNPQYQFSSHGFF